MLVITVGDHDMLPTTPGTSHDADFMTRHDVTADAAEDFW